MTINRTAAHAKANIDTLNAALGVLIDQYAIEANMLDGHDRQAAVFYREFAARLRREAGQSREQAKRIGEGSVVG